MFASKFLLAAGLMASSALAQITVSTPPSLTTCVPVALSWSGGTAPYYLSVIPGGQSAAAALEDFGSVGSVTSYTWTVDIASGTAITIKVSDSVGAINYSSQVTIMAGSTTCLNSTSSSSSAADTASSAVVAATSSAASAVSSASSAASAAVSSASSAAASAASSASSQVASATSAATSAATTRAASATSSAVSAVTSAAASATSAASGAGKVVVGSLGALFLGAVGVILA